MNFFAFHQNLTIYTDVTVIRPLKCQNQPFVSHLLAENPGPLIPSVVAILPDFDGFLQITSKLDYSIHIRASEQMNWILNSSCSGLSAIRRQAITLINQCWLVNGAFRNGLRWHLNKLYSNIFLKTIHLKMSANGGHFVQAPMCHTQNSLDFICG